MLQFSGPNMNS